MKIHFQIAATRVFIQAIILSLPLLTSISCTEEIDWKLEYQEEDIIVVEGRITNEMQVHEIRLSRPVFDMNGTPLPVSGAELGINDGRVIHPLTEDRTRPGTYLTAADFAGEVDRGYQLRIQYGDRRINAVSFMHAVTKIQTMRPYRVQTDPELYEVYISDSDKPAVIRMEMDWSHVPGYDTLPGSDTHAIIYHYTLEGVDVNRFFPPDRERVRFPPGTIVFREKESVSKHYEEFLRGVLSETDWRGGVFDVLPGNARTNLGDGAVGYFTATEVVRDTVSYR